MSEELLEAIKNYRPPKKLHPIAGRTYDLYDSAGFQLTDEALDEIRKVLEGYGDDLKALTDALCGLSAFVIYANEKLGDPVAAEKVALVMRECRGKYEPLSEGVTAALQDLVRKVRGLFDRFVDRDRAPDSKAPIYDDERPPNTVPLRELKPIAQPPMRRRRH
jgi:hypothetical protein